MEPSRVLLVNPAYTLDPAGGFQRTDVEATRQKGLFTRLPLLGLAYLASPLMKRGFTVDIRDCSPCRIPESRILEEVRRLRPAVVGVAVFSPQLHTAYSLLKKLEALRKGPGDPFHIVVGGPHISTDPAFAAEMPCDFGLAGDAENPLEQLCRRLRGDSDAPELDAIPGLVRRVDGRVVVQPIEKPPRLDDLLWPAHDRLDLDQYKSGWGSGRVTSVLGTRGCPYKCIFCGTQETQPYRERDPKDLAAEVAMVARKHGVTFVEFNDELFTYRRNRVFEICDALRSTGANVRFGCQTRADYVDQEMIHAMAQAGCARISFGIESGSARIRRKLGKNISDEVAAAAFRYCREAKVDSCALMMIGHPGETKEDVDASIRFAKREATITVFQVHRVTPETPLYKKLHDEGRVPATLWKDFMLGNVEFPYFVPDGLTLDYMVRSLKRAYREFYFRPSYLWYRLRRIRRPKDFWNLFRIALVILNDIVLGGKVRGGQIAQGGRPADRPAAAPGAVVDPV